MGTNDHRGTTIKHYKHWDCVIIPTGDGKCFLIHLPTWTKLYRDRIEYRDLYRGMSRPRVPSDKNKTFTPRKGALPVSECVVDHGVGFGVAQHIGVLAGTR